MIRILLALALAPLASWLVLVAMLRLRARMPASLPDHRTLHVGAVPRTGGLALWSGLAVAAAVALVPGGRWLLPLAALVVLFAIEDWRGLSPTVRLLSQAACVMLLLLDAGIGHTAGAWALAWSFVAVMWMTNLYNFMDGSDGLAALMTVIGFGAIASAAALSGAGDIAVTAAAVALAALPFLAYNWHPARIFLGDAGAVPLGFLAGGLAVDAIARGIWPIWFPVLVFLPFVADASITLGRRSAQGMNPLHPHRDHCYQRLVQLGWGHERTALAYAVAMLACAAAAVVLLAWRPDLGWTVLAAAVAVMTVAYVAVARAWANGGLEAR